MTTHDTFWARVDVLLDNGHDPFDDAQIASDLLREPALLDELEQLCERLWLLSTLPGKRAAAISSASPPTLSRESSASSPLPATAPATVPARQHRRVAAAVVLLTIGAVSWLAWPSVDANRHAPASPLAEHATVDPERGVLTSVPAPRPGIHSFHSSVRHERRDAPAQPATTARPVLVVWRQTWTAR